MRCLSCGAQPGLGVQTQAHLEPRDFALPRRHATIPIVPDIATQPPSVTRVGRRKSRLADAVAAPPSVPAPASVPEPVAAAPTSDTDAMPEPQSMAALTSPPPLATPGTTGMGLWIGGISLPSARPMITAAAAILAVLVALTVVLTLS